MEIETLGDALNHSIKAWVACAFGPHVHGMKRGRECSYRYSIDLETLVITRGRAFPIASLAQRIRCPRCGSRVMRVVWKFPDQSSAARAIATGPSGR